MILYCTESTLLAGLAGKLPLSAGSLTLGERWLQSLHWDSSHRDACDAEDETPLDFVLRLACGSVDESRVLALLDGIGVDRFAARRPIGCLSSGERTLTALTALCIAPKHLLLLDEPHAFLGAAAVQVLADALSPERWPGSLVFACSSRPAAEAFRPTQVALITDGRVIMKERPPCEEDWAEAVAGSKRKEEATPADTAAAKKIKTEAGGSHVGDAAGAAQCAAAAAAGSPDHDG